MSKGHVIAVAITFDICILSLSPEVKLLALRLGVAANSVKVKCHTLGSGNEQLQLSILLRDARAIWD